MRSLYFIRHGEPDFPGGKKMCLGVTDLPLSTLGRLQAVLAAEVMQDAAVTVLSSPLLRAVQTADALARPFRTVPGLRERSAGQWDGLTFEEIRIRFPQLYAARGNDPALPLPGGEDESAARVRFTSVVTDALHQNQGDLLFVTHASVMGAFFRAHALIPKPPYGSIIRLYYHAGQGFSLAAPAITPHPRLSESLCLRLLDAAGTPEQVVQHCKAVATAVMMLWDALDGAGITLDQELLLSAALLHDIARTQPDHPSVGGQLLTRLGYEAIGRAICLHHAPEAAAKLDEVALVFLADKLVQEDRPVSLTDRFSASSEKCRTKVQKEAHQRRFTAAVDLGMQINSLCGYTAVQI